MKHIHTVNIRKNLTNILILFFLVICIYFPLDPFGLKIPLLFLIFLSAAGFFAAALKNPYWGETFLWGMIIPVGMIGYSILTGGFVRESLSFGYPAVILLIVIVDTEAELSYEKMFRWTVNTLAFTILILVVLDILQICDINHSYIRELIYRYGIGFIGKSENYAFYYKVFLRCSPLIIYTFAYAVFKKKRILSFMLFAALFASGTRANVIASFFVIAAYLWFKAREGKRGLLFILFFGLAVVIVTILNWEYIWKAFQGVLNAASAVESNSVRIGHLKGLAEYYQENPINIITGSGMGSSFYSYGRNAWIDQMEWPLLDFFRQNGILFTVLVLIFIGRMILNPKTERYKKVGLLEYLTIAMGNRLLYTSTAYLGYIYVYKDKVKKKYENNSSHSNLQSGRTFEKVSSAFAGSE